jgi:hypothetical protein
MRRLMMGLENEMMRPTEGYRRLKAIWWRVLDLQRGADSRA